MRFIVKNSDLFPIEGNPHMIHLGTIGYGLREFWVMLCIKGPKKDKCYIEELVLTTHSFTEDITGNFKYIDDDQLALDLSKFAFEKGLTDVAARVMEANETKKTWLLT